MSRSAKLEVLVFDIGGVLIHFAGFEELPALLPYPIDAASVRERWIQSRAVQTFERGDIGPDRFAELFMAEWGLDMAPGKLLGDFVSWVKGPYPGATAILDRLRPRFRVACLSNSNALHTHLHRDALRGHVDEFFFSNELGLAKPDPAIFAAAIRELGVPAARVAFFDDTAANIDAAGAAGMDAHLTDGVDELEACLLRLGLLPG
ncbi:MAG TPA: HAD-IA family hydrolase [Chondromyces sp.]|nr:HAD-IA family hydrolase [Chondromyces sp.]